MGDSYRRTSSDICALSRFRKMKKTPFFTGRTHFSYHKFVNMVIFWSGNLYSLCSPGNQDYQKNILNFFIKKCWILITKFDIYKFFFHKKGRNRNSDNPGFLGYKVNISFRKITIFSNFWYQKWVRPKKTASKIWSTRRIGGCEILKNGTDFGPKI